MIELVRHQCGSMREATTWVLANLQALAAGGECSIDYIATADGVEVVVERVSEIALAMRRPAKVARAA